MGDELLNSHVSEVQSAILENLINLIIILNEDLEMTYINEKALNSLLDYHIDEVLNQSILKIIDPKDHKQSIRKLNNILKSGEVSLDLKINNKKNRQLSVKIKGIAINTQDQNGILLIFSDQINLDNSFQKTEEKFKALRKDLSEIQFWKLLQPRKCLAAIKSSQEILRIVMNNIPHLITWKDINLEYSGCNQNFAEFMGFNEPSLIIGKIGIDPNWNYTSLIDTSDKEKHLMEKDIPEHHNIETWKNKDGSNLSFDTNRIPLHDEENNVIGLLITYDDITDRMKKEEEIKSMNIVLEQKVRERTRDLMESEKKLREQNVALRKLDDLKNEFISMAAHELKTPLISISGYVEYILMKYNEEINQEIKEDMSVVQRNIGRLKKYINQLLDVMRIDENRFILNCEDTNVCKIIGTCIDELKNSIKEKQQQIVFDYKGDIFINADKERLSQVFSNLLTNAIKFTPQNGKIEIHAEDNANNFTFSVEDNGIGLNKLELKNLFNKFELSKYSDNGDFDTVKGSGLGLYITKGIIEAHGGSIQAHSEGKNKGSLFVFTLPA